MDVRQTRMPSNLKDYAVQHPDATVFLQAKNDGLHDAGIFRMMSWWSISC